MSFFEYACDEVNKTYKRCGFAGLSQAARIPGGWVFSPDYGPEYDGQTIYGDYVSFAFEDTRSIQGLDWRSDRYKELMAKAVLVDVPDEYLSERKRKNHVV